MCAWSNYSFKVVSANPFGNSVRAAWSMILDTLLLSGPSLSCQRLYSCVAFSWRGACVHAMNPHRFQHAIPRGSSHEDIWLSTVKFPDIIIIHRGRSKRKYYRSYTTWTPKHVHTFIFTHTHIRYLLYIQYIYLQTDRYKRGHTGRNQSNLVVISNKSNSESIASFE